MVPGSACDNSDARAALTDPHSDVMAELYGDDPLTPVEVAGLTAFLESEASDRSGGFVDGLWVLGLAGLLLLIGFVATVGFGSRDEEPA